VEASRSLLKSLDEAVFLCESRLHRFEEGKSGEAGGEIVSAFRDIEETPLITNVNP